MVVMNQFSRVAIYLSGPYWCVYSAQCTVCTVHSADWKPNNYFNTSPVHLLLFCTMTNKCTIISQIITLLHVSTLSCHPEGACNQFLAKLHKIYKAGVGNTIYNFTCFVEIWLLKIFKFKMSYL